MKSRTTALQQLAKPRWTVCFFVLTALASLAVIEFQWPPTWLLLPPLALLVVNLGAAIACLPRFRRDLPLLIFHLCLLLMVVFFGLSRLTYLHVTTAINRGDLFDGSLIHDERGPMHGESLQQLLFGNEGVVEKPSVYGRLFSTTLNLVRWQDDDGRWQLTELDDDLPLTLGHYRIYTSSYRGYTPLLRWTDSAGQTSHGKVQLNATLGSELAPTNRIKLNNGPELWLMLDSNNSEQQAANNNTRTNMGAQALQHRLVIRYQDKTDQRVTLTPGESVALGSGTLTYLSLDTWMGYRILYDPMIPWVMATIIVGLICLIIFYTRQVFNKGSWDSDR